MSTGRFGTITRVTLVLVLAVASVQAGGIELPAAGGAVKPDREQDLVEVLVSESGEVSLAGAEADGDRFRAQLYKLAEARRDPSHLYRPSELQVLIRADRRAPWEAVLGVFRCLSDSAMRIYRIHCAVRTGEGEEQGLIPTLLPRWRGLGLSLMNNSQITVRMERSAPGERTSVRLLDLPFLLDDGGMRALRKEIAAIHSRNQHLLVRIQAGNDVPWEDVVRVCDAFVSAGVYVSGRSLLPSIDEPAIVTFLTELGKSTEAHAEKAAREKWADGVTGFEGALFAELTGLTPDGYAHLTEEVGTAASLQALEKLAIRNPRDRDRVRELLETQETTGSGIRELTSKIEPSRPLLVALARLYMANGKLEDHLRALTLLLLVSRDPADRYSERWWQTQLLIFSLYDQVFRDFKNEGARGNILAVVSCWRDLGVLERSPCREAILKLEEASKR